MTNVDAMKSALATKGQSQGLTAEEAGLSAEALMLFSGVFSGLQSDVKGAEEASIKDASALEPESDAPKPDSLAEQMSGQVVSANADTITTDSSDIAAAGHDADKIAIAASKDGARVTRILQSAEDLVGPAARMTQSDAAIQLSDRETLFADDGVAEPLPVDFEAISSAPGISVAGVTPVVQDDAQVLSPIVPSAPHQSKPSGNTANPSRQIAAYDGAIKPGSGLLQQLAAAYEDRAAAARPHAGLKTYGPVQGPPAADGAGPLQPPMIRPLPYKIGEAPMPSPEPSLASLSAEKRGSALIHHVSESDETGSSDLKLVKKIDFESQKSDQKVNTAQRDQIQSARMSAQGSQQTAISPPHSPEASRQVMAETMGSATTPVSAGKGPTISQHSAAHGETGSGQSGGQNTGQQGAGQNGQNNPGGFGSDTARDAGARVTLHRLNMTQGGWAESLVRRIETGINDGTQSIRIILEPRHLGRLSVTMNLRDGRAAVRIAAHTQAAAGVLRTQHGALQQMFEQSGMRLNSLQTSSLEAATQAEGGNGDTGNMQDRDRSGQGDRQAATADLVNLAKKDEINDLSNNDDSMAAGPRAGETAVLNILA